MMSTVKVNFQINTDSIIHILLEIFVYSSHESTGHDFMGLCKRVHCIGRKCYFVTCSMIYGS